MALPLKATATGRGSSGAGSSGGGGWMPLPGPTKTGAAMRASSVMGAGPPAGHRAFALVFAGVVLGATLTLPMVLLPRSHAAHQLHLGGLPGHEAAAAAGPGAVGPGADAAGIAAAAAAGLDAAAAAAAAGAADGAGPFPSAGAGGAAGAYSLSGAAGEAAGAFARKARAARRRERVDPKTYLIPPEPLDMRAQHAKVLKYVKSPAFARKVAARRARAASTPGGSRGIIINAGGRRLLSSAVVTLAVLRRTLNCTMPVELVWHGAKEMDPATLAALQKEFGPLRGYSVEDLPVPSHHRQKFSLARFEGKVFSLVHSQFSEALLLDCDNIPFVDPSVLFEDPDYRANGNLFWPDFWTVTDKKDLVYDMVGLEYKQAAAALAGGKGRLRRDTESGAVLLDLARHADVIEFAAWINSYSDRVYRAVWGDKDTYSLAFAVAGKAHEFSQVQVPPGAALTWRPKMLRIKRSMINVDGWQLAAMVQFDHLGRPAFLHRTLNKFWPDAEAWPIERMTGPLPYRWVRYYLAQETLGPTVGVPYDYVVPDAALVHWGINTPLLEARVAKGGAAWDVKPQESCPLATFLDYRRAREAGLPLGPAPALDAACGPLLPALVGPARWPWYRAAGFITAPELLNLAGADFEGRAAVMTAGGLVRKEVGDPTPVPAWAPEYNLTAWPGPPRDALPVESAAVAVLRGQYEAYGWLQAHQAEFPVIQKGP